MKVLMNHNDDAFKRSTVFVWVCYSVSTLPFLYVCLEIIIRKQQLSDVASPIFITYAFWEFFIYSVSFTFIVYYGMLANNVDFQIKDIFINLSKSCVDIKDLCEKQKIWAKVRSIKED